MKNDDRIDRGEMGKRWKNGGRGGKSDAGKKQETRRQENSVYTVGHVSL